MVASVVCEQYIYGKLAKAVGGAIVDGSEHGCNGRSGGFPPELIPWCHPTKIGFGTANVDSLTWQQYPWRAVGGGIVCRSVGSPSKSWVLAARVCGRSEGGELVQERFYLQAHFVAIPGCNWTVALLPALADKLSTNPLTETNTNLPPLEIPLEYLHQQLWPSWDREVADILSVVMSGHAFSVQDWGISIERFLHTIACCLTCIQGDSSSDLKVGSGVVQMDGTLTIALGMRAMSGVRKVGGEVRGAADGLDLQQGETFVQRLGSQWRESTTLADLFDRLYPKREVSAHASRTVVATHPERAQSTALRDSTENTKIGRLRDWLEGATDKPQMSTFHDQVDLALALVLRSIRGRGRQLLLDMRTPVWAEAWRRSDQLTQALGMVIGVIDPARAEAFARWRDLDFEGSLSDVAAKRLEELLMSRHPTAEWANLLCPAPKDARWLTQWRDRNASRVVWFALDHWREEATSALWDALNSVPLRDSIDNLLHGKDPSRREVVAIAESALADYHECFDWLVRRACEAGRSLCALTLAEHASPWCNCSFMDDVVASHSWPKFVACLGVDSCQRYDDDLSDEQLRLLLLGWIHVSDENQRNLNARVGPLVGQPWARILLDYTVATELPQKRGRKAPQARMARDVFVARAAREPRSDAGLKALWNLPETDLRGEPAEALADLLPRLSPGRYIVHPGLGFLNKALYSDAPLDLSRKVDEQEVNRVRAYLRCLGSSRVNSVSLLQRCSSAEQALACLNFLPEVDPLPLEPALLVAFLTHCLSASDAESIWRESVVRLGAQRLSGWRLLAGERCPVDDNEHQACMALPSGALLALTLRGVGLRCAALNRMTINDDQDLALNLDNTIALLEVAEKKDSSAMRRQVAVLAASVASRNGLAGSEIEKQVLDAIASNTASVGSRQRPSNWPEVIARALAPDIRSIIQRALKNGD